MTAPIRRNSSVWVRIETTYGTDPVPDETYAQLVHDAVATPGMLTYERPVQTVEIGRTLGAVKVYDGGRFTGRIEIRGRGDAITNAKRGILDPWLRATGWTSSAYAAGWPYVLASGDAESVTIYVTEGGCLTKLTGCRGNGVLVIVPGQPAYLEVDLQASGCEVTTGTPVVDYSTATGIYPDVAPPVVRAIDLWAGDRGTADLTNYTSIRSLRIDPRAQATAVPCASSAGSRIIRQLGHGPATDQGCLITWEEEGIDPAGGDGIAANQSQADALSLGTPLSADTITIADSVGNDIVISLGAVEVSTARRTLSGDLYVNQCTGRLRQSAAGVNDSLKININP